MSARALFAVAGTLLLAMATACGQRPSQPVNGNTPQAPAANNRTPSANRTQAPRTPKVEGDLVGLARRRAGYATKLTTKGPAPQEFEVETPPDGVEVKEFKSGDLILSGWLGVPKDRSQPLPALVFAHGGFAFAAEDYEAVASWVETGWVVFVPLFRGENDMPGTYDLFYHEVDDLIAAGEFVSALPYVNPKAVFAMGHSVGGTRCILASMLPGPFASVASVGGAPDLREWIEDQTELAPFDLKDANEVALRNPIENVDSIHIPLIVAHGSVEVWCIESTERFVKAAREAKKNVVKYTPKGNHFTCFDEAARLIKSRFESRFR